jgi:mono/diheme cytochrome c family protein
VNGDPELLAKIILHGVQGPLEVKGKKYTGYMQGFIHALETPENVAAVMTYVRNTWGNKDPSLIQGKHVEAWINKTKNQTQPYTEQQLRKEHKVKK